MITLIITLLIGLHNDFHTDTYLTEAYSTDSHTLNVCDQIFEVSELLPVNEKFVVLLNNSETPDDTSDDYIINYNDLETIELYIYNNVIK